LILTQFLVKSILRGGLELLRNWQFQSLGNCSLWEGALTSVLSQVHFWR